MKCYMCDLMQVSTEQGYITKDNGGNNLSQIDMNMIYDIAFWEHEAGTQNMIHNKIIVTKTINPYIVKELVTGLEIPVLHSYKKYESGKWYVWSRYPFGKIHTYVRSLKCDGTSLIENKRYAEGFKEICEPYDAICYVEHLYPIKEEYKERLLEIFKQGEEKMKNKELEDRKLIQQQKECSKKIKKLVKDSKK